MNVSRKSLNGALVSHVINGVPQPIEPTNLQRARNVAAAITRAGGAAAKGKRVLVSTEEQQRRMAICSGSESIQKCDFYTGTTCKKCGCHIRFKAKLQTEHCPIGKW